MLFLRSVLIGGVLILAPEIASAKTIALNDTLLIDNADVVVRFFKEGPATASRVSAEVDAGIIRWKYACDVIWDKDRVKSAAERLAGALNSASTLDVGSFLFQIGVTPCKRTAVVSGRAGEQVPVEEEEPKGR